MTKDGFRQGVEIFLSYRNDDGEIKTGFYKLIILKDTYLQIENKLGNQLIIPMNQVLKIKLRG